MHWKKRFPIKERPGDILGERRFEVEAGVPTPFYFSDDEYIAAGIPLDTKLYPFVVLTHDKTVFGRRPVEVPSWERLVRGEFGKSVVKDIAAAVADRLGRRDRASAAR